MREAWSLQPTTVTHTHTYVAHALTLVDLIPGSRPKLSPGGWEQFLEDAGANGVARSTGFERPLVVVTTRDALGERCQHIRAECFDAVVLAGGWSQTPAVVARLALAPTPLRDRPLLCVTFFDGRHHGDAGTACFDVVRQTQWWHASHQQTFATLVELAAKRKGRR